MKYQHQGKMSQQSHSTRRFVSVTSLRARETLNNPLTEMLRCRLHLLSGITGKFWRWLELSSKTVSWNLMKEAEGALKIFKGDLTSETSRHLHLQPIKTLSILQCDFHHLLNDSWSHDKQGWVDINQTKWQRYEAIKVSALKVPWQSTVNSYESWNFPPL